MDTELKNKIHSIYAQEYKAKHLKPRYFEKETFIAYESATRSDVEHPFMIRTPWTALHKEYCRQKTDLLVVPNGPMSPIHKGALSDA